MFTDYYGLSFNPFDKQCQKEKDCFQSNDFRQMSSRLSYVRDVRGIGVFTAQPGMGKSFCLRCFAKSMNQNLGHMEYICLSTVGIREFYYLLCSVLEWLHLPYPKEHQSLSYILHSSLDYIPQLGLSCHWALHTL